MSNRGLDSSAVEGSELVLAVYGTLAPGESNHDQMAGIDGTWEEAWVRGHRFTTTWRSCEGFPGFIVDPAADEVPVLLFRSRDLALHWDRLDDFEGPGYERRPVVATTANGNKVAAEIYEAVVEPDNTLALYGPLRPGQKEHFTVSHLLAKPAVDNTRFAAAVRGWSYEIGWGPAEGWEGVTIHGDGNLIPVTALFDTSLATRWDRLDRAMGDGFVRSRAELVSADGSRVIGRVSIYEARPDA